MKNKKTRYYTSFSDDFEKSANQDFQLPDDYKWIRNDFTSKLLSAIIYSAAIIFSGIYCKFFLHMKIIGRKKFEGVNGCFIYGNHTQPLGDVFIPALCAFPKRIYTVVSTANYGIPFIGKILPFLGALPIVGTFHGIKQLNRAVDVRIESGHPVVIYPEAHVWEYYTDIRPFPETSFKFPIKTNAPCFAMTSTYKKRRFFKRPKMCVYIDGPFYPEGNSPKEKTAFLHNTIYSVMKKRSLNSNYKYIEYTERPL